MISFQGRIIFINLVLNNIPVIKEAEKTIRNLLWTRDPSQSRATIVSWDKVCKPLREGGLGIRRLKDINSSMIMKMARRILTKEDDFSTFLKLKYFNRDGDIIQYYKASSIWSGIRATLQEGKDKSHWVIGNGNKVDLIRGNWLGTTSLQAASSEPLHFSA
ncbi:hypothetical protein IFM89_038183 [Coptis chinensis]|uniref:Uncharacterized protein n=1 Tax=Coptis chinensis TaxID=261450 RepID=A0A835LYE0_9MAGN|nr:hypothetical protein IFM89_038183 [Coptis chinensis]